jgi:uncharacterized protein (DUF1330 family)
MAAYAILEVEVHDIAEYLVHHQQVAPLLEAAGARYLARGGSARDYEGAGEPGSLILIEFPSLAALDAFYTGPDYRELQGHRDSCSTSRILAVEGLDGMSDVR